jgi:hypothetical protein
MAGVEPTLLSGVKALAPPPTTSRLSGKLGHAVVVAGLGAVGSAYGVYRAFVSSSWIPAGAGLVAGLCVGALAAVVYFRLSDWVRREQGLSRWSPAAIYLIALVGLSGASGSRMLRASANNHFVYLADSLNHGRLSMRKPPPHGNDWAKVVTVELRDGTELRGRWWRAAGRNTFRTQSGELVDLEPGRVRSRESSWYVSFPPLPATLMMPGVSIWGYDFNDVLFTILIAALNPLLCFLLLEDLKLRGYSRRTRSENLWLTLFFCFGTVHFYCSVVGEVWYTAQVLGATMMLGYLIAGLDVRHPLIAGLFVGLGFITRTPLLFAFPYIAIQALSRFRVTKGNEASPDERRLADRLRSVDWKRVGKSAALFATPVVLVGLWMAWLNWHRFGSPFEFGHTYLSIRWAGRIQRWGLFNLHYVPRNLAAAFALLPHIKTQYPYVIISRHGISLLATTPLLVYAIWPKRKIRPLHYACWAAIGVIALSHFMYQNSGYVQFTYRFSLDYTPVLVMLLALSGRPMKTVAKALLLWGVAVHTFGALSFGRWSQFYARGDWLFVVR